MVERGHCRALERNFARPPHGDGWRRRRNPAGERGAVRHAVAVVLPADQLDYARVNITMPPGTTLKQTEEVVDRVAAIVAKDPTVERVFERIMSPAAGSTWCSRKIAP
jgi:hypothetical protein